MAETVTVALRVRGGTTSGEDPNAALLELTEPLARRLLDRIDQVAALRSADPEVRYLVLRGEQLTWLNGNDVDEDPTELGEEELLDDDWDEVSTERLAEIEAVTAADPEVEYFVEGAELVVDRDGVSWRAYPKYGEETFTTATLSREGLVELARRWQLA